MIFGHKENFAIECIIENSIHLEFIWGHIVIWIGKQQLGQRHLKVLLKTPVTNFKESLKKCDNRREEKFETIKFSEIFIFLQSTLWGEPERNKNSSDIIE